MADATVKSEFITRVELHDAGPADYDLLHAEMKSRGFERTITNGKGVKFALPTAEYDLETDHGIDVVHAKAVEAAEAVAKASKGRIKKQASIIVTKMNGCKWSGLDVVKETESK